MTSGRQRLFVPTGALPTMGIELESLRSAFDVVEVESIDEARRLAAADGGESASSSLVLGGLDALGGASADPGPPGVLSALAHIGEGVGVVEVSGAMTWANPRLQEYEEPIRRTFVETCVHAMEQFDQRGSASVLLTVRPSGTFRFAVGNAHYEVLVSIAAVDESAERKVCSVVGILWDVSASCALQEKIDAIDAAGSELMRLDAAAIANLNMAERLALLEERIIRYARDLLDFDQFEVRLVDQETNQLELVINRGLVPLRIGEVMHAEAEGNGISGYVANTGECYLCNDVTKDPRYRPGLERAGSSLTVPLRLYDRILGVFNIESPRRDAFDENDLRFAQIFGRYVAMAMHILDLLVVERYTTNEQVATNVLGELEEPLEDITTRATSLRAKLETTTGQDGAVEDADRILQAAEGIRRRMAVCAAGPRSLLGAEQELHRVESDPLMVGKRVILADNERAVRDAIGDLLRQKGCEVTLCDGGEETIELIRASCANDRRFDLVISDIKMPDRSGYEVFQTTKECSAETPVILITGFGYDPHHSIVRASQEGLHSYLFKPLQASQLVEAVTKAFRGEPG